jgi:hypothetical protein
MCVDFGKQIAFCGLYYSGLHKCGHTMYNTRWVSTVVHGHPNEDLEDSQMSLMVMQFGQFLGLV